MKKSKVFGAVLCSAALACSMGAPAFAATSASVDTGTNTFDNSNTTANTIVKAYSSNSTVPDNNISATVPLAITVVIGQIGGNNTSGYTPAALTCPDKGAYYIKNNSKFALEVTDCNAVAATGWTLAAAETNKETPAKLTTSDKVKNLALKVNGLDLGDPTADMTAFSPSIAEASAQLGLDVDGGVAIDQGFAKVDDAFAPNTELTLATVYYTVGKKGAATVA